MEDKLLQRINKRKKKLIDIQYNTDIDLQYLTDEMQEDHQIVIVQETQESNESRKKLRDIRKEIEEQQQLLQQYKQVAYRGMVLKNTPKTPVLKNALAAFIVGGIICVIGQIISNGFVLYGFTDIESLAATSGVLIIIGALLTGVGVYDEIGKFAGAGSIVPITGFANSIAASALEFKREGYIYGVGAKVFTIAGPVILYGTLVSIIIGLVFFINM